jgi:CheY-like chemotaxis protein
MHIIYVEDDPSNVALVERVVHMGQDRLTTYASAEEAARDIWPGDADLILMDIDFRGGMNGLELTQMLRERGVTTPIIAITAYDLKEYVHWAQQAGNDDFVVKPVNVPDLLSLLDFYRPA